MSEMLTVWRSLHIERDHMGAPGKNERFANSVPAPVAGQVGFDDVDPGGPIPDPSIDIMVSHYRPAYIEVRDDLTTFNRRKEMPFVHNVPVTAKMDDASIEEGLLAYAKQTRDVNSQDAFWALQMIGAYEMTIGRDNDPVPVGVAEKAPFLGVTVGQDDEDPTKSVQGANYVFTETIRDVYASNPDFLVSASEEVIRTAFHETVHSFGLFHKQPLGDEGPLGPHTEYFPDREVMNLTAGQLAWLRATKRPM